MPDYGPPNPQDEQQPPAPRQLPLSLLMFSAAAASGIGALTTTSGDWRLLWSFAAGTALVYGLAAYASPRGTD